MDTLLELKVKRNKLQHEIDLIDAQARTLKDLYEIQARKDGFGLEVGKFYTIYEGETRAHCRIIKLHKIDILESEIKLRVTCIEDFMHMYSENIFYNKSIDLRFSFSEFKTLCIEEIPEDKFDEFFHKFMSGKEEDFKRYVKYSKIDE